MKISGMDALEFIEARREEWKVPGLAIALHTGTEERFFVSGQSSLDPKVPFSEDTLVPVGSVTKPLLAHAASRLVRQGLLSWNTPLSTYIPDLKFTDRQIQKLGTLLDFLSMRTGLDGTEEWQLAPLKDHRSIKSILAELPSRAAFRRSFIYSGFSTAVAAMVLESVAGRPWTELITESMTQLGLKDFAFSYEQALKTGHAALGYQLKGSGFALHPWPEGETSLIDPAVSLCLSARSLLTWLVSEMDNPEKEALFTPHVLTRYPDVPFDFWPESYGLCWGLRNYRGHPMIYHRGSDWGFRTVVAMIPDRNIKIAIVSNRSKNLLIHLLLNHLLDEVLGHSSVPWSPLFDAYAKQTNQI